MRADQLADLGQRPLVALQQLDRRGAGDRLDAPQVGADRPLADDLHQADVAGRADVRTAAQLDRRPGLEHADDVAVLLAEERDRAHRLGLGLGGLEHARPLVAQRLGVDQLLDLGDLLVGDRLVVREVEAQPVGADVRAGLLDVIAEHPAQRPVQQVRAGVVAADRLAALDVDRRRRRLTGRDRAVDDARRVAAQVRQRERRVEHLGLARTR